MFQPEQEIVKEFDLNISKPDDRVLVELLKSPTRIGGELARVVNPPLWYGQVYDGPFDGPKWEEFKALYAKHAQDNPDLNNPYVAIGPDWQPVPIHTIPKVKARLEELRRELRPAVAYIAERYGEDEWYERLGLSLQHTADSLPLGQFDEVLADAVSLPDGFPLIWHVNFVERYNDPEKRRAAPQGLIGYKDGRLKRKADNFSRRYREACFKRYGFLPTPARVFVAKAAMLSGFLARYEVSGFHIPNDRKVIEEAGNSQIGLLAGRMYEKNARKLSPALAKTFGLRSDFYDIFFSVIAHEQRHGYRYLDEKDRWGRFYGAGREFGATIGAIALLSEDDFSDYYRHKVIKGSLAYAAYDNEDRRDLVFAPVGHGQVDIEGMLARNEDHRVGEALWIRHLVLGRLIKFGGNGSRHSIYNMDGIIRLADDWDRELDKLARKGSPDEVRKYLLDLADERKYFPVNGSNGSYQSSVA